MKIHELKTVQPFFEEVWKDNKNFEIRKNDRDFQVGDLLILKEYDPATNSYSGREVKAEVSYILNHQDFPEGLQEGYCCLAMEFIN